MENKAEEQILTDKCIFTAIAQNDLAEFKNILAHHKDSVDIYDENGMTAVQHAAYKGNKEMVQLLLDRGANVNSGKHEYNYSALHFGGLSGNSDLCKLLLDAGALPQATNSLGRTPAQLAGFVGNHHTVATINNYIPISDISYYSIKQGQQTEPYLPPVLVEPLHKFVLGVNIHPIRLALNLQHQPSLLHNAEKVSKVLDMMCKREMNRGSDTNEVFAFKCHYLAYILKEIGNIRDKKPTTEGKEEKKHDIVEIFAKKLLKPGKDGLSLDFMDTFLKDCVREFPYRECTTFHQLVSSLTGEESRPALNVIDCTLYGIRGFADSISYCSTCGEEKPAKKCSKCKTVQYCDRECQRLHWFVHKKACSRESSAPSNVNNVKPAIDTTELSAELQNLITF